MARHANSVENFCYVLEKQIPITKTEQQTLRNLINLGFTFDDINSKECIQLIRAIRNERIILILTANSMEKLAKPIREEPFLSAIYVIDSSTSNTFDSKLYRKSFSNITQLCQHLETDLPCLAYDLTSICSVPAGYTSKSTLSYFLTLKDIVLDTDRQRNLKKEMLDFCREKYADNVMQLKLIDDFEANFRPDKAIDWYSRQNTFIYKMLTRAMRILDADILYRLRYFIQHLHHQLESSTDTKPLTVYRKIRIRKDLFRKMQSYQEALLSFNEFFFASKVQTTVKPAPMNAESKLVHFQIHLEGGVNRCSVPKKNDEVLLTFGTVFRVDQVEAVDEETFKVTLTTNGDTMKAGQLISKDLRSGIRGPFPLVRMAKLMKYMELWNHLEYFASILMDDPPTATDEAATLTLGGVLHALGGRCYDTKQYEQGLTHLQNSLKVYLRFLSPDDIRLTPTYNNIGSIYHRQGLNDKALEYHQKAYQIQKTSSNPDMESVAAYAGNMASVLVKLDRHKEAVKYYEIDLKINQKRHQNKDHADIAVKYHNLAGMQYRAQMYSEALGNYKKCLEIELKCHSAKHPTVAVTYHNMATALEKLGQLREAKEAVEKAVERLLLTKDANDEEVKRNRKYLQHLEEKMWVKNLMDST